MGYVDIAGLAHTLPDGRQLFADVSFRVGEGKKVALVGPNGAGKTTLLRMVAGDLTPKVGTISRSGDWASCVSSSGNSVRQRRGNGQAWSVLSMILL